jgi:hypothetical protein
VSRPKKKRAKPPVHVTDAQIASAIESCAGQVGAIAKLLDVTERTVALRINRSKELLDLQRKVTNDVVAIAEAALIKILRDPDMADHAKVVMFTLRTKGRKLGYSERIELGGTPDAEPIKLQFFVPAKEEDEG